MLLWELWWHLHVILVMSVCFHSPVIMTEIMNSDTASPLFLWGLCKLTNPSIIRGGFIEWVSCKQTQAASQPFSAWQPSTAQEFQQIVIFSILLSVSFFCECEPEIDSANRLQRKLDVIRFWEQRRFSFTGTRLETNLHLMGDLNGGDE